MKIIFIIMIIICAVASTVYNHKRIVKLHIVYKELKYRDSINGKIKDKYTEKGAGFFSIKERKFSLPTSANYLYDKKYLDDLLSVGDSIIKHSHSDTIFIIKEQKMYFFILGKFINKP